MSHTITAQAQAIFGEAVAFHQRGQLDQAQARYEFILNAQPGHYPSFHLLGVLAAQTKNFQAAIELIGKAIDIFPKDPNFHINRGNALKELKQLNAAAANYEKAIALKPDYAEAHSNHGVVLQMLRQMHAAVAAYYKAIALKPDYAEAYSNLGNALKELGQMDAAIASCDKAIAISPGYAGAHFNRALALQAMRRLLDAVAVYERAKAARPSYADACFHCGIALQELKRLEAAVASYDKAVALRPDHAQACYNRGVALVELQRPEAAIASYDQAIASQYDFAQAHSNRGVALQALRQWDAAVASFDNAIALQPDYAEAYANRGVALHALKQLDAALACYDKAIVVQPDLAEAHFYKSLVLLLRGELEGGWDSYQWLWKTEKSAPKLRHFTQPAWTGAEALRGKTILIHSEQGVGDMIQFCRYIRLLAGGGGRVVLEVPAPLMGLLRGIDGVSELVAKGSALPEFDYHCLLLVLPRAFGTSLVNIPGPSVYLRSDPGKVAQWTARLGSKTKRRVGLVWSGSAEHAIDYNRSIALSALAAVLPDGFEYVSLQKEMRGSDMPALGTYQNIRHFGDELVDFGDTAALSELMDVVISVDTRVAHLSGALDRPTWVLFPYVPDWRWLLERDDSPWYPSVRLFRQSSDGDWNGVFQRVSAMFLT